MSRIRNTDAYPMFLMSRDSQLKALIFGGVAAAAPDSTTEGKKIKKKNSRLLSVESRSAGDDTFRHGLLHLAME